MRMMMMMKYALILITLNPSCLLNLLSYVDTGLLQNMNMIVNKFVLLIHY